MLVDEKQFHITTLLTGQLLLTSFFFLVVLCQIQLIAITYINLVAFCFLVSFLKATDHLIHYFPLLQTVYPYIIWVIIFPAFSKFLFHSFLKQPTPSILAFLSWKYLT